MLNMYMTCLFFAAIMIDDCVQSDLQQKPAYMPGLCIKFLVIGGVLIT